MHKHPDFGVWMVQNYYGNNIEALKHQRRGSLRKLDSEVRIRGVMGVMG